MATLVIAVIITGILWGILLGDVDEDGCCCCLLFLIVGLPLAAALVDV